VLNKFSVMMVPPGTDGGRERRHLAGPPAGSGSGGPGFSCRARARSTATSSCGSCRRCPSRDRERTFTGAIRWGTTRQTGSAGRRPAAFWGAGG